MKKRKRNKILNRIFSFVLILILSMSLFTGCTFEQADTCTDPNCTECANVVYAEELDICTDPDCVSCTEAIDGEIYVDCPDCEIGGEYVTSTFDCDNCDDGYVLTRVTTTCTDCNGTGVGSSTVTCTVCGGDTVMTCPDCTGLGYTTVLGENYGCVTCGGNGERMASTEGQAGTGTVTCTNCTDGTVESSRCGTCTGSGEVSSWEYVACDVTACQNGTITKTTWVECETCFGEKGWWIDADEIECDYCGYSRKISCPDCTGLGYVTINGENFGCVTCGGNGERMNGATAVAGTGTLDCPYCTDTQYFEVTYICVDLDGYGFEDYTATVKGGDSLPTIIGWSSDTYYLSLDSDGLSKITKSTVVSSDMTVYVHILSVSFDAVDVNYYELRYNLIGSYYYSDTSEVYDRYSTLNVTFVPEDYYHAFVDWFASPYEFIGWHVSTTDLKLTLGSGDYVDYFTAEDVSDIEDYIISSDLFLYAVYEENITASDSEESASDWFSVNFNIDIEEEVAVILQIIIYAVIVIAALLVLFLVIKIISIL